MITTERKINILIPMAGAGKRFREAGFKKPKPLIDVLGEPMVKWALKSVDFLEKVKNYQLIFVILKEHDEEYNLEKELKKIFGPEINVIKIDKITRGEAETCLAAKEYINNSNKLFVYDCDSYSISKIWDLIKKEDPDGILVCFKSQDPRYSYVKLDESGYVCQTAEKKVISNFAISGTYYFKKGKDFIWAAEEMIKNNELHNNEFYMAPCYNYLLKLAKKIKIVGGDKIWIMGTPEELNFFIKNYPS